MKKIFCLMMVVVMLASVMLTGCGKQELPPVPTDTNVENVTDNPGPNVPNNTPNNEPTDTKYIKNGKLNYFDVMFFRFKGANGEGYVEVMPDGLAMNALIKELKELYPDMAKSTIQNIVSPMVSFDNTEQSSGLHNGDIVTIEVSVIQSKLDMWNEYFGDIELVIETTHTITVEGLE